MTPGAWETAPMTALCSIGEASEPRKVTVDPSMITSISPASCVILRLSASTMVFRTSSGVSGAGSTSMRLTTPRTPDRWLMARLASAAWVCSDMSR